VTPKTAYRLLNKLIWCGRLPKAKVVLVDDSIMPSCYGLTLHDNDFVSPVIFLNLVSKHSWAKTLIHEMIHVAEPTLNHGVVFEMLVESYWRIARKKLKGLK
jgi:hypothetical protein